MELPFINTHNFQSLLMKCKTLLMNVSLSLKKNSASENAFIIGLVLVVLILVNIWSVIIPVVCFIAGYKWATNNNNKERRENGKH